MARAIDVDRVKREIRKNKEKIVISCKQKYVPLSLIYEILNKAPTLTPPNEPLSLEQLREMDGEPVWVVYDQDAIKTTPGFDPLTLWALVEVTKNSIFLTNNLGGRTAYADDQDLEWEGITVYRRPPAGEKDT